MRLEKKNLIGLRFVFMTQKHAGLPNKIAIFNPHQSLCVLVMIQTTHVVNKHFAI